MKLKELCFSITKKELQKLLDAETYDPEEFFKKYPELKEEDELTETLFKNEEITVNLETDLPYSTTNNVAAYLEYPGTNYLVIKDKNNITKEIEVTSFRFIEEEPIRKTLVYKKGTKELHYLNIRIEKEENKN